MIRHHRFGVRTRSAQKSPCPNAELNHVFRFGQPVNFEPELGVQFGSGSNRNPNRTCPSLNPRLRVGRYHSLSSIVARTNHVAVGYRGLLYNLSFFWNTYIRSATWTNSSMVISRLFLTSPAGTASYWVRLNCERHGLGFFSVSLKLMWQINSV